MLAKRYSAKTTVARVRNPEYIEIKEFSLNDLMGIDLISLILNGSRPRK